MFQNPHPASRALVLASLRGGKTTSPRSGIKSVLVCHWWATATQRLRPSCTHTQTDTHTLTWAHTLTHTYGRTPTHTCRKTHTHAYTQTRTHTHTSMDMHKGVHTGTDRQTQTHTHGRLHTHTYSRTLTNTLSQTLTHTYLHTRALHAKPWRDTRPLWNSCWLLPRSTRLPGGTGEREGYQEVPTTLGLSSRPPPPRDSTAFRQVGLSPACSPHYPHSPRAYIKLISSDTRHY